MPNSLRPNFDGEIWRQRKYSLRKPWAQPTGGSFAHASKRTAARKPEQNESKYESEKTHSQEKDSTDSYGVKF